jgi:hypothetical protein
LHLISGVSKSSEKSRFSGQTADTRHFRRLHRLPRRSSRLPTNRPNLWMQCGGAGNLFPLPAAAPRSHTVSLSQCEHGNAPRWRITRQSEKQPEVRGGLEELGFRRERVVWLGRFKRVGRESDPRQAVRQVQFSSNQPVQPSAGHRCPWGALGGRCGRGGRRTASI